MGRRSNHDPPYARRNGQREKLKVITAAETLEAHTYRKCRNVKVFPKKDRGGLPNRMVNEACDVFSCISEANDLDLRVPEERRERLYLQRKALTRLRLLMHHIEVVHDNRQIGADEFEYWGGLAKSVRNQAAAWHKSDKARAERQERDDREEFCTLIIKAIKAATNGQ